MESSLENTGNSGIMSGRKTISRHTLTLANLVKFDISSWILKSSSGEVDLLSGKPAIEENSPIVSLPVSKSSNSCLCATGLLPEQFRMANLEPIFKPGKTDTSSANNYRGISLTCILSKVVEKIVFNQLNDYLTQCGALSDNQYGFRRGRSCADLLLTIGWLVLGSRCQEIHSTIALIDLTKAFDDVHHEFKWLLLTLQKLGPGLEKFSLCYSPQWNHSKKISRQTGTRTQNLVAKAEHQSEELQNGAKKTRELQVHLEKDARHLNLCTSKVFAVKLENMFIIG